MLILTRFGNTNQLHRVDMPMGDRTQLTFFDERVAGAAVRPGDKTILFARDVGGDENFGGYLLDPDTGRVTQFTQAGTRNQAFIWSDDGAQTAWAYVPQTEPNYDVFVREPAGNTARRVLDGEGAIGPLDFSPDGRLLLLARRISVAESDLLVLDIASGTTAQVTPELDVAYGDAEFMPDGRSLIALSDENSQFARLVRIDLATSARTVLTPDLNWSVEEFKLSHDGRTLAYSINEAGRSALHLMDLRTGRALAAPRLPPGIVSGLIFDRADNRLGFTLNSATAPGDAYSWDLRVRRLTRWTQSETGGIPASTFVDPELVSWLSFDGREISGFYYKPRTAGPHPVVIQIHGGPESQFRPGFSSTIQYWVNELGVAVIAPNVRGSTGYGKDFMALDNAELREDSVRDIGALLDWIDARPDLDSDRVMVYGGSYGGYMALASMTHYNDRLAGGVDIIGIANFHTFLENTAGYRVDLRRVEYGDERDPATAAMLRRISPITNIRNVTKPMLVVMGYNDPRVPYTEGEQVTRAIRANGGEVWFMLGMNEGHGFQRRENQRAQREAETLFMRRVLRLN